MFVIIVGCGRIGRMLALELAQEGHNVTVIEKEKERLKELGGGFNGIVIEGLGIDEDILIKAGIEQADAFLAVSQEDNINMMCAQIAKRIFGVPKVIARNYKPELKGFYEKLGLEVICTSKSTVDTIKNKVLYSDFEILSELTEDEIIFIRMRANEQWDGVEVNKVEEDEGVKIIQVKRHNAVIYVKYNERIRKDDMLIIGIQKDNIEQFNRCYKSVVGA
ncbi:MAG: TrkA-N domain protein [Clostridia bacterium]|jgi:trk system potassium uptake protein TrkA|nr:TrkA-N domain protein [Clostridia bacterium]